MRIDNIDRIISVASPYRLVNDLSLPIEKRGDQYFTSVDGKTNSVEICEDEFVDHNPQSNFIAGNVVDFLAQRFGWKYDRAVEEFASLYDDCIDSKTVYEKKFLCTCIAETCRTRREIFKMYNTWSDNFFKGSQYSKALQYLRRRKIETDSSRSWCAIVTGFEAQTLATYLNGGETPNEWNEPDEFYIVTPFFSGYHRIAYFVLTSVEDNSVRTLTVEPSRFSFAGLLANRHLQRTKNVPRLCEDWWTSLKLHTHNDAVAGDYTHLGLRFDPSAPIFNSPVTRAIFYESENSSLPLIVKSRDYFKEFNLIRLREYKETSQLLSFSAYIVEEWKKLIEEECVYTPRIAAFEKCIEGDNKLRNRLLQIVREREDLQDIADGLERPRDEQIYRFKNYDVYETSGGYVVQSTNSTQRFLVTNFTLHIDYNIVYEDSDDITHGGRLVLDGKEYPLTLQRKDLNKTDNIEFAALRAFKRGGGNRNEEEKIPIVTDKTYAKALPTIINHQIANANQRRGWSALGWSSKKSDFITPTAIINRHDDLTQRVYLPNDFKFSHCYSHLPFEYAEKVDLNKLDNCSADLLAMVAAVLCRSYICHQIKPVYIRNTGKGRNSMRVIFSALGQKQPIEINPNERVSREEELFTGLMRYAFYGTCVNPSRIEKLEAPLFFLCERGYSITTSHTKESALNTGGCARYILSKVIRWLLVDEGKTYELPFEFPETIPDLIEEGNSIVINALSEEEAQIYRNRAQVDFSALKTFFMTNARRVLTNNIKYSLEDQFYVFQNCEVDTSHASFARIFNELIEKGVRAGKTETHIAFDKEFYESFVNDFYGENVQIRPRPCEGDTQYKQYLRKSIETKKPAYSFNKNKDDTPSSSNKEEEFGN